MKINKQPTKIAGVIELTLGQIQDNRGGFRRVFCAQQLASEFNVPPMQVNLSSNKTKGTLRGMHFQHPPACEIKIIHCVRGAAFDVAVDLRRGSDTFLQWTSLELNEHNGKAFLLPHGVAHGFQTLEDDCQLLYFHSHEYTPEAEAAFHYASPELNIKWPLAVSAISDKDMENPELSRNFKGIEV